MTGETAIKNLEWHRDFARRFGHEKDGEEFGLAIAALRERGAIATILLEVLQDDWESMSYHYWDRINKAIGSPVAPGDQIVDDAKIDKRHAEREAVAELVAAARIVVSRYGYPGSNHNCGELREALAKFEGREGAE